MWLLFDWFYLGGKMPNVIVRGPRIVYPQPFSDHFVTIGSLKSLRLTDVIDDKGAIDRNRSVTLYRSFNFDLPLFWNVIRKNFFKRPISVCFYRSPVPRRNTTKKSVGPIAHFTGQALVNRGEK